MITQSTQSTQSTQQPTPDERFASWILKGGRELIADATRIDRGTPRTLPVFDGGRFSFLTDGHGAVDAETGRRGSTPCARHHNDPRRQIVSSASSSLESDGGLLHPSHREKAGDLGRLRHQVSIALQMVYGLKGLWRAVRYGVRYWPHHWVMASRYRSEALAVMGTRLCDSNSGGRVTVLVRLTRLIVRHLNGTLRPNPHLSLPAPPLSVVGEGCHLLSRSGNPICNDIQEALPLSLNHEARPAQSLSQPVAGQGFVGVEARGPGPSYTVEGVLMWDEDSAEAVAQRKANDLQRSVAICRDGELWREIQPNPEGV